jgi:hypothetical protein
MEPFTGKDIYVRDQVARMLADANARLQLAGLNLIVGYGYRAPIVQKHYWNAIRQIDLTAKSKLFSAGKPHVVPTGQTLLCQNVTIRQ